MFAMNSKNTHTRYSGHNCTCVAGSRVPPSLRKGEDILMKTVRLKHFRAALLAAAAGLLAAVGLVVVLYTQPAEANYPGKPGKIAFANNVSGGDEEIYTINASGGGELNVTDNDTGDFYPSYSPSGNRIAYVN